MASTSKVTPAFLPTTSNEQTNRINIRKLIKDNRKQLDGILMNEEYLRAFFQRGKTTKDILLKKAAQGNTGKVSVNGIEIRMLNLEKVESEEFTFPRFCAALSILVAESSNQHQGIIRSLGAGLVLDADEESKNAFNCFLVPGAGYIPNYYKNAGGFKSKGIVAILSCIALDAKRYFKDKDEFDIVKYFESDKDFSEASGIAQLIRQGIFESMNDDDWDKLNGFFYLVRFESDGTMTKRIKNAFEMIRGRILTRN